MSLSIETKQLLGKYFDAVSNLYAVIPLRKVLEIYNSQNEPISEDDICSFADSIDKSKAFYSILAPDDLYDDGLQVKPIDREIIAEHLTMFNDLDEYEYIKFEASGKPYYIPPKEKLLRYADQFFIEKTLEFLSLRSYLRSRSDLTRERADEMAEEAQVMIISFGGDTDEAMESLARMGLEFKGQQDFNQFYQLCTDVSYSSRLAIHRGHTFKEIMRG